MERLRRPAMPTGENIRGTLVRIMTCPRPRPAGSVSAGRWHWQRSGGLGLLRTPRVPRAWRSGHSTRLGPPHSGWFAVT